MLLPKGAGPAVSDSDSQTCRPRSQHADTQVTSNNMPCPRHHTCTSALHRYWLWKRHLLLLTSFWNSRFLAILWHSSPTVSEEVKFQKPSYLVWHLVKVWLVGLPVSNVESLSICGRAMPYRKLCLHDAPFPTWRTGSPAPPFCLNLLPARRKAMRKSLISAMQCAAFLNVRFSRQANKLTWSSQRASEAASRSQALVASFIDCPPEVWSHKGLNAALPRSDPPSLC